MHKSNPNEMMLQICLATLRLSKGCPPTMEWTMPHEAVDASRQHSNLETWQITVSFQDIGAKNTMVEDSNHCMY
jgi:hypothetical protein